MNPQGERVKTILIQGLAIVGFVAILFTGLWGTVQVVKLAPSVFSNLAAVTSFTSIFVPNKEITIDTQVSSDDNLIATVNEADSEDTRSPSNTDSRTSLTAGERTDEVFPISDSRSISNSNGRVDLKATIISTGIVDVNNVFTQTSSIGATEQGVIRFSVTNIGSKTSDNWTFNAVLPTFPMYIFHSTNQKALAPGDRIDFTLGFDQLNRGLTDGVITINVDPTGSILNESNRDNNIAQVTIQITQ